MTRKDRLLGINASQRAFYEAKAGAGVAQNPAAGVATNLWTRARNLLQHADSKAGVRDAILAKHREWLGDLSDKDVLDLGCNSGNSLSVEMASSSRSYLGIDLSAPAIEQLRDTLRNIPNARVEAIDFLAADYRQRFDVIYAHSVLHHFEDFDLICAELRRALRPGGAVISLDPLQTDPVNKMIRLLYRPFQADRNWEWPFTIRNFEIIRRHFIIEAIQGFRGASRAGLVAGSAAARGGLAWDLQHANKAGLPLLLCWMVAMKFCKRPSD